jgi:hypothetical protein
MQQVALKSIWEKRIKTNTSFKFIYKTTQLYLMEINLLLTLLNIKIQLITRDTVSVKHASILL